jgi:hypothetical protein
MKLLKTVDEKFEQIGFVKVEENEHGARYERKDERFHYTQVLDLLYKASGKHIVQSYDPQLTDQKGIGNTCAGLSMYEMQLCIKKMKQMGWKVHK